MKIELVKVVREILPEQGPPFDDDIKPSCNRRHNHAPAIGGVCLAHHITRALQPIYRRGCRAAGQSQMLRQPLRRDGILGLAKKPDGRKVGGVQPEFFRSQGVKLPYKPDQPVEERPEPLGHLFAVCSPCPGVSHSLSVFSVKIHNE